MSRFKIILLCVSIILVITLGAITGIMISQNKQKGPKVTYLESKNEVINLTDTQKEMAGLKSEEKTDKEKAKEDEEKTYSKVYKEYQKLSEEEKAKIEAVPREKEVKIDTLDVINENLNVDEIPSKFNLADKIDIKVENQGSYGLCWDFAALNTLETYLALHENKNFDFSEMHVNYIESKLIYGNREIDKEGSFDVFKQYLNDSGVVLERDVPYKDYTKNEYDNFKNMEPIRIVTETVDFPTIYKYSESNYSDEEIAKFRETVKKHIMQNGGLYAGIVGTGEKNAYVAPEDPEFPNHAVTIVGWDDNYSKDNFLSSTGKKPEHNGAYIALNSWGPNRNDGGYYYISYEDKYVEGCLSGIASTSLSDAYKLSDIGNEAIKKYFKEEHSRSIKKVNGEEYITKILTSSIGYLEMSDKNVSSLSGFEIFENLYYLDLSRNNISNISNLANMKNLSCINFEDNNITDVSPILKLNEVFSINLAKNKIQDVSSLESLNDNIDRDYKSTYRIDLSNNKGIKGYEKLKNASAIVLDSCDIKELADLSKLENLTDLFLNNNENIILNKFPSQTIYSLYMKECNLTEESLIGKEIVTGSLDISNNSIKNLDFLKNIKGLYYLDVSENNIENWEALKEYTKNMPETEVYDEYNDTFTMEKYFYLLAKNTGISDISIFNGIEISDLDVSENNIKDLSNFKYEKIYSINLSGNKGIKGLESLNKIQYVTLNNCDLEDIDEISKLGEVFNLSLANNNITDISKLSELKSLYTLSLADNKNLTGRLKNNNLTVLNLENCDIDNSFDFSGMNNLCYLNLKGNPRFNNLTNTIKKFNYNYFILSKDEINYDEFLDLIDYDNINISFEYGLAISFKGELKDNKIIIDQDLKNILVDNNAKKIELENGKLDKENWVITVDDTSKDSITLKTDIYNYNRLKGINKFVIKYTPVEKKEENLNETSENTISNVIDNSTENTVINDIVEENTTIDNNIEDESQVGEIENTLTNEIENELVEETV